MGGDVRPPEAVGTIVVPIVGGLIAVVIVIGAAVVVMRGKSSVEKAERAQAAAAAGDNRLRLDDGTVSEFDVEQTGNPLSGDPQQQGNGFVAHRSAGSGAYVPPSLGYQPPVIAV